MCRLWSVGGGGGDSFFYFGAETFRLRNEQGQSLCLYFNEKATQFIKILDIVKKKTYIVHLVTIIEKKSPDAIMGISIMYTAIRMQKIQRKEVLNGEGFF